MAGCSPPIVASPLLDPDGAFRMIAEVASEGSRMNDGAADPQGRFWAGTVADRPGAGVLYRLERDGRVDPVLDGLTTSNGIGWSPDGRTMYLADSGPRVIHAFDFDGDAGTISGGRVLVTVPEDVGAPDGLTVDADGDLWVAIWGGGRVHRYSPAGELRQVLAVPAVADDELRVRRPRPASAVRHDRHRGLDGRRASRRPEGRARLPIRDRCDRTPGRPVPPGPSLVELIDRSLKTDDFGRLARSERRTNRVRRPATRGATTRTH